MKLLLAAALVAALVASPALADTTCTEDFSAQVTTDGACAAVNVTAADLASDSVSGTTIGFTFDPQPKIITANDTWEFTAGIDYTFNATGSSTCSGKITTVPCTPVCNNLEFTVDAAVSPACTTTVTQSQFFDATSIAPSTPQFMSNADGVDEIPPLTYPVGYFTVTATAEYNNGNVTSTCSIKVTDVTKMSAPVATTIPSGLKKLCFYSSTKSDQFIAVPASALATLPTSGPICSSGMVIEASDCQPYRRGSRRICSTITNGFNLIKRNIGAKQTIKVTLQSYQTAYYPIIPSTTYAPNLTYSIDVYKKAPGGKLKGKCTPVNATILP